MELKNDVYEAVLIIGNGFDLNLGLKTDYNDFIKSEFFLNLIDQGNEFCKYLQSIQTLQNWIDIENELKAYSKITKSSKAEFNNEFKKLSINLANYLRILDYTNIDRNGHAYNLIKSLRYHTTFILDFNQTLTFQHICKEQKIELNEYSNFEHIKIHGSLNENDNIIFGIEDNARISPQHVFLKKSVNENFNPINFSSAILESDSFIVFGHSLGETDHMYFEDFFRNQKSRINDDKKQHTAIYHNGGNSYFDLFAQIDQLTINRISRFKQNSIFSTVDSHTTIYPKLKKSQTEKLIEELKKTKS